jgi:putative transposase
MSKSRYNPLIHHRRSIRLKGYDYSQKGSYFLTFCTQNRKHFFGEIEDGEMVFNDAGTMINEWWEKLPEKYPDIQLGAYITMPNHFHGIVINTGIGNNIGADVGADVGADPRVRPNSDDRSSSSDDSTSPETAKSDVILGEHVGSPLRDVVRWFKTMTTNAYIRGVKNDNWERFDGKLWQRNYYEHIIRDEKADNNISNYIINNPKNWEKDTLK